MILEEWDVYNSNKEKIGETIVRNSNQKLKSGQFHLVCSILIINSKKELLLTQRSENKKSYSLCWEIIGGSCLVNEDSKDGIIREVKEEIGVNLNKSDLVLLKTVKNDDKKYIKDIYIYYKDLEANDICFVDNEVKNYKWILSEEFSCLKEQNLLIPTIDIDLSVFNP